MVLQTMKQFINKIPIGIPSILITLLVAYLCLWPNPLNANELMTFDFADKMAHFVMFFGVSLCYILDYAKFRLPHHTKINIELMLTATASLLALVMEVLQLVMQMGRSYEQLDIVFGASGAIFAWLFYHFWFVHPFRNYLYHSTHHRRRHHSRHEKK